MLKLGQLLQIPLMWLVIKKNKFVSLTVTPKGLLLSLIRGMLLEGLCESIVCRLAMQNKVISVKNESNVIMLLSTSYTC